MLFRGGVGDHSASPMFCLVSESRRWGITGYLWLGPNKQFQFSCFVASPILFKDLVWYTGVVKIADWAEQWQRSGAAISSCRRMCRTLCTKATRRRIPSYAELHLAHCVSAVCSPLMVCHRRRFSGWRCSLLLTVISQRSGRLFLVVHPRCSAPCRCIGMAIEESMATRACSNIYRPCLRRLSLIIIILKR